MNSAWFDIDLDLGLEWSRPGISSSKSCTFPLFSSPFLQLVNVGSSVVSFVGAGVTTPRVSPENGPY